MKLKALLLAVFCTFAAAQDVQETNNLVGMMSWQGTSYPNPSIFSLCCSGGPDVAMNTSTNTLRFSYGDSTAYQMWQIDNVLPGTGIKVSGFKYSWWIDNSGETRGTISANVRFASNTGALLENYNYSYGPTNGFTRYTGTELFASPYAVSTLGQVGLAFTGRDASWWAGYYGPRVRDASLSLLYTAGPAPTPTPAPTPVPVVSTSTTTVVSPTETVITETVTALPMAAGITEPTTTTTLISTPMATATPTATPARTGGPANSAAVSMVLKNNAAQQAALQSTNLATSVQQSQTAAQDNAGSTSSSSDAVSLGMSSFGQASKQISDSMSAMDSANPTSTRNLLSMMTARHVDSEQQDREDRQARAAANQSSSASAVGVELGTGASLTAIAAIPQGYAAYSVQMITQTPFYAPKEIYRNQRTVDNDNVRRGLSGRSDRLHQEIVDSQYRGN